MAALTTPFAPAGVRGPTARAMSSRSISQRVPAAGARVQPRKVNVAVRAAEGSIREQAGRRGAYTPDVPSLDPRCGTRLTQHKTLLAENLRAIDSKHPGAS